MACLNNIRLQSYVCVRLAWNELESWMCRVCRRRCRRSVACSDRIGSVQRMLVTIHSGDDHRKTAEQHVPMQLVMTSCPYGM